MNVITEISFGLDVNSFIIKHIRLENFLSILKLNKHLFIKVISATLFSGFITLIDLPVGENNDIPITWSNPQLADYLFEDDVSSTSFNFNAMNESYMMCKIQNGNTNNNFYFNH